MKNVRLEAPATESYEPEDAGGATALVSTLASALRKDATRGAGDEDLADVLASAQDSPTPAGRRETAIAVSGLAGRIESSNGRYPNLIRSAAGLDNGSAGDERERALYASKNIIRPLAGELMSAGQSPETPGEVPSGVS